MFLKVKIYRKHNIGMWEIEINNKDNFFNVFKCRQVIIGTF